MASTATSKERLRNDLTTAMKARDSLRSNTLRMVLAAISEAEVAGKTAVQLTDEQIVDIVVKEAKKRREAAEAFRGAGRVELADKELSEAAILADYLPEQLTNDQIAAVVTEAISEVGAAELGMRGMGEVMALVTPRTKGRADGKAVADEVRRQLSSE